MQQTFESFENNPNDPHCAHATQGGQNEPVQLLHNLVTFAVCQSFVDGTDVATKVSQLVGNAVVAYTCVTHLPWPSPIRSINIMEARLRNSATTRKKEELRQCLLVAGEVPHDITMIGYMRHTSNICVVVHVRHRITMRDHAHKHDD